MDGSVQIEVLGKDLSPLSNEAGGHRIQRVPPTERKGRVHTSTVVVTVLEELEKVLVSYNDRDFKVEWYSGTGAGGQHRNKHQNSCRLTHLPTGLCSTAQCRSRENSFEEAKSTLLQRIASAESGRKAEDLAKTKREQGGSGERGDKIRTYMFQHGKVTDHVTGKSCPVDRVMAGRFEPLWPCEVAKTS